MARNFCAACGSKLLDGAAFCGSCGTPVSVDGSSSPAAPAETAAAHPAAPTGPQWAAAAAPAGDPGEMAMRAFVGPNADYYLPRWRRIRETGSTSSWNWAAFFLSAFWLAYRKMWQPMLVVAGMLILGFLIAFGLVVTEVVLSLLPFHAASAAGVAIAAWTGVQGNNLYRRHTERKLAEIGPVHDPAALDRARLSGGTSLAAAIGLWLAWSAIISAPVIYAMHETDAFDRATGSLRSSAFGSNGSGSTSDDSDGIDEDFLLGRWAEDFAQCNAPGEAVEFMSGGRVQSGGDVGTWRLDGSSLTISAPGQPTSIVTLRSTGRDNFTMTRSDGVSSSFIRCP